MGNVIGNRIYNTVRGEGENTKERAILLTMRQCREHRRNQPMSTVIRTDYSHLDKKQYSKQEEAVRTMLWP